MSAWWIPLKRLAGAGGWRAGLLPLILAATTGLFLGFSSAGTALDRELEIWRAQMHPRSATGDLVFVEIDARSLASFSRWPWPRAVYAQAIGALQRLDVQAITFDVDFSSASNPQDDAALARAIATSRVAVTLPTFRQRASQAGGGLMESLPIEPLRDKAQLAAVNIYADADGLVRSYPYAVSTGGIPRPSVAAMLAGAPGRANTMFPIDISIDPATVPRISFIDLVQGRVAADRLRGRQVLIGASAIELGDFYPIPGRGALPGPLVQMIAAETLLQKSAPASLGFVPPLLLALIIAWCLPAGGARRQMLCASIGIAGILALPILTEWAKIGTFDIVPAIAAILVATITCSIIAALRSARDARLIDQATGLPTAHAFHLMLEEAPGAALIGLRLANYGDIAGVLGPERAAEFVTRVAERVALASDSAVFRIEESALAWIILSPDLEEQVQRVDAAAAMVRAPFEVAGRRIELGCGFGLAYTDNPGAATRAIHAADKAVARSVRWVRHTDDLGKESAWRLELAGELDRAMTSGAIWVAYQPKLDLGDGAIRSCEALVRWRHPERGPVAPDSFIPVLEETGRIADLTLHVLERALFDCRSWAAAGVELGVAVNLSASLPADRDFVGRLQELLARFPDIVPHLTLEVTESATISDPAAAIQALDRLAALGLRLSIDDYGTGQSTLSYLKRLPAREIKIDKSFVQLIESSRGDQAMVRSSIELAHELGFKVVAEGVETAAALDLLRTFGCDTAQGWHIGRPVPADELLRLVSSMRRNVA